MKAKIMLLFALVSIVVLGMVSHWPSAQAASSRYVVLSFDDSLVGTANDRAVEVMNSFGFRGVAFHEVSVTQQLLGYDWQSLLAKGWEFGCHSWWHSNVDFDSSAESTLN